jgi:(1->4)-alpha-D-glucan 1-alpha-D-glucosylmutase
MSEHTREDPAHIPSSTYRLQLNRQFNLEQAAQLADYLSALGIGDCYLSPFLTAAPGSMHGYDVVDPTRINPEIGTREDLERCSRILKRHGLGIIADVVPNHMCIEDPANRWWWDVLENGPSSRFARYFDIDWNPPKQDLVNKVLLPILGDQYGRILEDQQITVEYDRGSFFATVNQQSLPLAPRSWALLLEPASAVLKKRLGESDEHLLELESILTALSHLAPSDEKDAAKVLERQHETEVIRRRLTALMDSSEDVRNEVEASRREINGVKGSPRSFDRLEELLGRQSYRLAFWKVAADEINYRRFFDINQLAAIRVEDPEVFQAVHALLLELIRDGEIDGLRVDHSDGLRDPAEYFSRLQAACTSVRIASRPFFVVTEKILSGNEELRSDWPVEGTTGYDFLGQVNGLFIDRARRRAFYLLYEGFTGCSPSFEDLRYVCQKLILQTSMSSELNVLANKLDKISERQRWSRDFTRASLRHVLRETIACFPIYRTYITEREARPDPEDERHIRSAIGCAKRRNQSTDGSIFDFLKSLLLLEDPDGIDDGQRSERREFVMSLQQFTGPVVAKGLEDTAFYRQSPLASLNEVGSDPRQFGISIAAFHTHNMKRLDSWPHALLATATHDSKRSEDVRARINVLSEIPGEWYRTIRSWRALNVHCKTHIGGAETPSGAEEYLFYQTLAGVWPLHDADLREHEELTLRMQAYMRKVLREAKVHSSWINPNQPYEEAVDRFVGAALKRSPENRFMPEFIHFVGKIKAAGMWNSLSQTLLKIASPGVPDFYQGNEMWDFSLVDPDNRRPVDYELRRQTLDRLRREADDPPALIDRLASNPANGALKLFVISRALCFRKSNRDLLEEGAYIPLRAAGARQNHVIAFARNRGGKSVLAVASRFFMALGADRRMPTGEEVWGDSVLKLRQDFAHTAWRDVFSQSTIEMDRRSGKYTLPLAKMFAHLPVALLYAEE